jgi:Na+/H+-translocating membrane pyrophosphatase
MMRIELKPQTRYKALWIAVFGFFLPILIGLLFRLYRLLLGQPITAHELAWSFAPSTMTVMLLSFFIAGIPFVIASLIAVHLLRVDPISTATTRVASVAGMVIGTALFSTVLYFMVWRSQYWEDFFFMNGAQATLPYMLACTIIGLGLGWVVGRLLQSRENKRLRPQPSP